jgi:hypothetical protein
VIIAEDSASNTITTEDMGYEYQYHVIPEFPLFMIMPLFMMTALLAIIVRGRKRSVQMQKDFVKLKLGIST